MTESNGENLPNIIRSSDSDAVNNSMLYNAVRDAGLYAYGTIGVEVWVLNKTRTSLVLPSGGFWVDEIFLKSANEELLMLTKTDHPDYVGTEDVAPGVGLSGALWAEASRHDIEIGFDEEFQERTPRKTLPQSVPKSKSRNRASMRSSMKATTKARENYNQIIWRDIHSLVTDPFQPSNKRLQLLQKSGFGLAAGVSFKAGSERGLVVYLARRSVDTTKLQSFMNEDYLLRATDLIGSMWALRGPRQVVIEERKKERKEAWRRARLKILFLIRMKVAIDKLVEEPPEKPSGLLRLSILDAGNSFRKSVSDIGKSNFSRAKHIKSELTKRMKATVKKSRGANVPLGPCMSSSQSLFIFVGAFMSLITLSGFNVWVTESAKYPVVLGPFGAFTTLQYSLTMAPPSQPRNAILGQTLSMTIAISLRYIDALPGWVKQALAPSLSIAAMARLGITHPPAGASALIFATGSLSWGSMGMTLVANVIVILIAVVINNFNQRRQYPLQWGLVQTKEQIISFVRSIQIRAGF